MLPRVASSPSLSSAGASPLRTVKPGAAGLWSKRASFEHSPSPAAPSPSIVSMQHQHRLAYASSLYSHDNKLACMAAATAAPAGAMTTALEPIATGSTASSQAHTACKQHHGMPRPHGPSCGLASATQPGAGKAQVQPHQKHSHHHPTSHNQQHQHQHQQVYWVYRASVGPAEAHAMCEAVRAAGCNSSLMALEHSPELTLQLYGCLELVAMDQAVADAAGMQDAEAHDLRTGQVTFLHRNGPGAPWAVVGIAPTDARSLAEMLVGCMPTSGTPCPMCA